jgi:hypothetical protein
MRLAIVILLVITNLSLFGQKEKISGIVVDNKTLEPLGFTNIGIVGKQTGTVSNIEGSFTISTENILPTDSVFFSYVGYKPHKVAVSSFSESATVKMHQKSVELSGFSILSKQYSPIDILDLLKFNFSKNHVTTYTKQRMFYRDIISPTFYKKDIKLKNSTNEHFDDEFVDQFNERMPESLSAYNDFLVDFYNSGPQRKLVPVEGQSLIENWNFDEEFDKRIGGLVGDVEDEQRSDDNYFKVRSGLFAGKLNFGKDTSFTLSNDSLHYYIGCQTILDEFWYLMKYYSIPNKKRLDFVYDYRNYDYKLNDIAIINGELAYIITFSPARRSGIYEGTISISTETFALLQMEYNFAEDKDGRKIYFLGMKYLVDNRSGRVIYEKGESGYRLKYISRISDEVFGVDRTLTVIKKKENGFFDKKLSEIKMKVDLDVGLHLSREILIISEEKITPQEYNAIQQPKTMQMNKVSTYSSEIWKNSSIIEPTQRIKEYQKQFE